MKSLTTLAILVFSSAAFACPQISGTYTCDSQNGSVITIISQVHNNGAEIYTIDGYEFVADGLTYSYYDDDFSGNVTSACTSQNLNISIQGDILENGAKKGYISVNDLYYMTNEGLVYATSGNIEYEGKLYPVNEKVICTKN